MMESSSCFLCAGFHIKTSGLLFFITFVLLSFLTCLEAFDARIELPRSKHFPVNNSPRAKRVLHVDDYGAIGDGIHDDTEAFLDAWKVACSLSPRSKIVVPYGNVYLVRKIDFSGPCQSKVVFQISGTIVAPKDPSVWRDLNPTKWIYFHGLNHLTVEGGGTVNGMGKEWWDQSCKTNSSLPCHHAPTAITFHRCSNLVVTNLNLIDSPQMHVTFTDCSRVDVSNMSLVAPAESPNTDGIHISSSVNVVVRNSLIKTGDDCISVVNNSSRVEIRNIACGPGHGISIGSLGKYNSCSVVHDVVVDGALLVNTKNGVRVKTWQGGMGYAANITFRNVLMENVLNPIIVDQYYCDAPFECQNQTSAVKVEGISYISIKGTTSSSKAIKFACSDNFPCDGLYLEDIQLMSSIKPTSSFCWAARGSSSGLVLPPPCFPNDRTQKPWVSSCPCFSSPIKNPLAQSFSHNLPILSFKNSQTSLCFDFANKLNTDPIMGAENSGFEQKMDVNDAERLKYLGFIQAAALHAILCFASLYAFAKEKSGPLKPGVESVESAVKTAVYPVYNKFHDVPIELLKFVDRKMDESMTKLDGHIPPVMKQVSTQAFSAAQKAPEVARGLVSEVQRDGVMGTAKKAYVKYEPVAKDMYSKYEPAAKALYSMYEPVAERYAVLTWQRLNQLPLFPKVAEVVVPTAAYCSEQYNRAVISKAENGYRVANYLPLVPTEKIAKVFSAQNHEAETEIPVS